MAKSGSEQAAPEQRWRRRRKLPGFDEAPGEAQADSARDSVLTGTGQAADRQAEQLSRVDPALRADALFRLQAERGNRHVQRVVSARKVQRQPGDNGNGGGKGQAPAQPLAPAQQPPALQGKSTWLAPWPLPPLPHEKRLTNVSWDEYKARTPSAPAFKILEPPQPVATQDDAELVRRVNASYRIEELEKQKGRLTEGLNLPGVQEATAIDQLEGADRIESIVGPLYAQIGVSGYDEMMGLRKSLITRFEKQAYDMARYVLHENSGIALREAGRYAEDQELLGDLRGAIQQLAQAQTELLVPLQGAMMEEIVGGGGVQPSGLDDFYEWLSGLEAAKQNPYPFSTDTPLWRRYLSLRQIYGERFPILLARNIDYSKLNDLDDATLLKHIQSKAAEVMKNIRETDDKLEPEKIWDLPPLVARTKQFLGIAEGSGADQTLTEHQKSLASDSFWKSIGLAALQIGLGILAAVASGGLSLALTIGSAAVGIYQASEHYEEYGFQQAAAGTSLDPAQVLGNQDPSLFWLAVDIVGAVIDAGAAFKAFSSLSRAAKAVQSASRAAGATAALAAGAEEVTDVARGAEALKELEEVAQAQARVLKQEGKLPVGMTEDLFVQRIMSSARRNAETAGEAAARRTDLVSQIVDGSHPRLEELASGNPTAMQELLTEHGNWKQLVESLQRTGRKDIADQLKAYRDGIAADLESLFGAKPMTGGSKEAVSDIDFFTSGTAAGDDMIRAEAYMANKYGANWSEMFRMNLYTEGGRLTRYRDVLKGLGPAERVAMQAKLTAQTERFAFARMLQHAGGDADAIRRVESLAKSAGVDLEELKSLATLDEAARTTKRAELSREIDALQAQYDAALTDVRKTELAEEISTKQIEANFYTEEAYIGPGAVETTVLKGPISGHEAYQAALSNLEMIEHAIRQAGGDITLACREYELYKYINRFTEAAKKAGVESKTLTYFENLSEYVYRANRQAQEEVAHAFVDPDLLGRPGLTDLPQVGGATPPVTDKFLQDQFQMFMDEAERVVPDLKPPSASPSAAAPTGGGPTPKGGGGAPPTPPGAGGTAAKATQAAEKGVRGKVEFADAFGETHEIKLHTDGRLIRCSDECIEQAIKLRERSARMRKWLEPTSATRQEAADLTKKAKDLQTRAHQLQHLDEHDVIALAQSGADPGAKLLEEAKQLELAMAEVEKRAVVDGRGQLAKLQERLDKFLKERPKLQGKFEHRVAELQQRASEIAEVMKDPNFQDLVFEEMDKLAKETRQLQNEMGALNRRWFDPTEKHMTGGWGTKMDLDDVTAEEVLNRGIESTGKDGKQVHGLHDGKIYVYQPDNVGGWHGYPAVGARDLPPIQVLRAWRDQGLITRAQYIKFTRGEF